MQIFLIFVPDSYPGLDPVNRFFRPASALCRVLIQYGSPIQKLYISKK